MSGAFFALLEAVHGHLAMLGLALLLHPIISLRRRPRLTKWTLRSADLGALFVALPFAIGWFIYPAYREHIKPGLLTDMQVVAMRFETKEHLAFLTLALVLSGVACLRIAGADEHGRRIAWHLLMTGWLCGVTTAVLGIHVASVAHPGF